MSLLVVASVVYLFRSWCVRSVWRNAEFSVVVHSVNIAGSLLKLLLWCTLINHNTLCLQGIVINLWWICGTLIGTICIWFCHRKPSAVSLCCCWEFLTVFQFSGFICIQLVDWFFGHHGGLLTLKMHHKDFSRKPSRICGRRGQYASTPVRQTEPKVTVLWQFLYFAIVFILFHMMIIVHYIKPSCHINHIYDRKILTVMFLILCWLHLTAVVILFCF